MMVPLYTYLEKNQAEDDDAVPWNVPPRDHEQVRRSPSAGGCSYILIFLYFGYILLNLLSQERAQLRLQQVFYPGGERGKSVNIEASINREVTEAGAELSIMRCSLD